MAAPVYLAQGVAQRGQMRGSTNLQGGRCRKPPLNRGSWLGAGPVDQQGADTHRSQVVNSERQERLDHLGIAVDRGGGDDVDPVAHGRLVAPGEAAPAQHAKASYHPYRPRRMALNNRGLQPAGQDHEVAFRARRPIEQHPFRRAIGAPQKPGRQPVGKATGGRERLLVQRHAGDVELRPRRPGGRIGGGLEDRATAWHSPLVNSRSQSVIDLLHQHRPEVPLEEQAGFLELLGESL